MSFAPKSEILVNDLIQAEYCNACINYGGRYNSLHEGYAVLKEEIEEAEYSCKEVKLWFDELWESIKNDSYYNETEECLDKLFQAVFDAISELAQVGAVVRKIRTTVKVEE